MINGGLDNDGKYVRHVGAQKQVLQFEILTNSDSAEKVNIANRSGRQLYKIRYSDNSYCTSV